MVEGIFKQIQELDEFIQIIEDKFKIIDRKSHFIIEDLKKEAFFANPYAII